MRKGEIKGSGEKKDRERGQKSERGRKSEKGTGCEMDKVRKGQNQRERESES